MNSIKVMISSRVGVPLLAEGATVGDAAERIRDAFKGQRFLAGSGFDQEPLFEFDLSLESKGKPANRSIESYCREMVAQNDIVLALYNGQAGSQLARGADGVCFLEMRTAMDFAPEKLVVVQLPQKPKPSAADKRFREWFAAQQIWSSPEAKDVDEVVGAAALALRVAVAEMVKRAGKVRFGAAHLGGALEWSRMDYEHRAAAMRAAVHDSLLAHGEEPQEGGGPQVTAFAIGKGEERVFTWIHAIPAAISEPHAREMVGQPHLSDHLLAGDMSGLPGPLHIVACARGVTEAQAVRILGFPDATIIKAPFGVFVADEVQKIQMAFLGQCRDEPSTHDAVTQFIAWLDQSGERRAIVARGRLRADMAKLLAKRVR